MAIKNQTGQDSAVFYNNKDFKNSTIYAFHLLPDQLDRICEKLGGEAGAEILDSISPIFDFAPKALRHRISTASTSLAPAAKAPCRRPMFANGCLMHSAPSLHRPQHLAHRAGTRCDHQARRPLLRRVRLYAGLV